MEDITRLIFQLAFILLAAQVGGEIAERYLKLPSVLGELAVGMVIGPFALGGIAFPGVGSLFHIPETSAAFIAGNTELAAVAQMGAIVLLFHVGLETEASQFFRHGVAAGAVAMGGLLLPFFLGAYATVLFGFAPNLGDPVALFVGAIMTATSVGVTARVLRDLRRLDSPEGVTILGAAVVDDVLGILVLTVVVGIAGGNSVGFGEMVGVGGKALGFWLGLMAIGLLLAPYISRLFLGFRVAGAAVAMPLGLGFLAAALAESFGLAMIIGAYTMGLALSGTQLHPRLIGPMTAVYQVLAPIFFVFMGMLVDFSAMGQAIGFGLVVSALAVTSKFVGAGLPARFLGFTNAGAIRIGVGMIPRGEVALIIAGVGLSRGIIGSDLFGVSIMMTAITTILSPILLVPLFRRGGPGKRR